MQQSTDMFRSLPVWFCLAFLLVMADPTPNFLGFVSPDPTPSGSPGDEYTVSLVGKPSRTASVDEHVPATDWPRRKLARDERSGTWLVALAAPARRVNAPSRASPHPLRC